MNLLRRIYVKQIVFYGKLYVSFQCLLQLCQDSFLKAAEETCPGAFAGGRGGSKPEELLVVPCPCVSTFCQ